MVSELFLNHHDSATLLETTTSFFAHYIHEIGRFSVFSDVRIVHQVVLFVSKINVFSLAKLNQMMTQLQN